MHGYTPTTAQAHHHIVHNGLKRSEIQVSGAQGGLSIVCHNGRDADADVDGRSSEFLFRREKTVDLKQFSLPCMRPSPPRGWYGTALLPEYRYIKIDFKTMQ